MDNTLITFTCIALAAATILFVVLAIVVVRAAQEVQRIADAVQQASADLSAFKAHVLPLVEDTARMVRKTEQTLVRVDANLDLIRKGTQTFADVAQDIRSLEQEVVERVRQPLSDLTAVLSGGIGKVSSLARKFMEKWA